MDTLIKIRVLWESVEHWLENWELARDGKGQSMNIGAYACPCCEQWSVGVAVEEHNCIGCPVYEDTGQTGCFGTPWQAINIILKPVYDDPSLVCKVAEEYTYLVGLALNLTDELNKKETNEN